MTVSQEKTTVDQGQLDELLGRFVTDLGATISAGNVLLGDKLGLYRALVEAGPLAPAELATYTGTAERYVREWLAGRAASGYLTYDAATGQYAMTPEQALAFADPAGLALPGAFELAAAAGLRDFSRVAETPFNIVYAARP